MAAVEPSEGCVHYKRKIKFVAPCCNKFYTCRYCHDENETHKISRIDVTELVCTGCNTVQTLRTECVKCSLRFGKYACLLCKLYDDVDKKQYHCDGCGICRIGGRDRFFHCEICNMCLPVTIKDHHKCVENMSRTNCPVCMEHMHTSQYPCHIPHCGHLIHMKCFEDLLKNKIYTCPICCISLVDMRKCVENMSRTNCPVCMEHMHTSQYPCHIPHCGHLIHMKCFEDLLKNKIYTCPICCISLVDMRKLWREFDREVSETPIPTEIQRDVAILCRDCQEKSTVAFHLVGLKCSKCGSYNTCRIKESPVEPDSTS